MKTFLVYTVGTYLLCIPMKMHPAGAAGGRDPDCARGGGPHLQDRRGGGDCRLLACHSLRLLGPTRPHRCHFQGRQNQDCGSGTFSWILIWIRIQGNYTDSTDLVRICHTDVDNTLD